MRKVFAVICMGLAVAVLSAGQAMADKVEIKGPHICCGQCVKAVGTLLGAVDGVTDVKADIKTKMVTFTAKDEKAAKAGVKALVDGGLFGSATSDGKTLKVDAPAGTGDKADAVVVKDVHVCCGQCEKGVKATFKGGQGHLHPVRARNGPSASKRLAWNRQPSSKRSARPASTAAWKNNCFRLATLRRSVPLRSVANQYEVAPWIVRTWFR